MSLEPVSVAVENDEDDRLALVREYEYLLTSQLESQRVWFEEKMAEAERVHAGEARTWQETVSRLQTQVRVLGC